MSASQCVPLCDLRTGEQGRIIGFDPGSKIYRQKLLAMGLTPGTVFQVKRVAPLGDPIELEVRGFSLSLRRNEAGSVKVEKIAVCKS